MTARETVLLDGGYRITAVSCAGLMTFACRMVVTSWGQEVER